MTDYIGAIHVEATAYLPMTIAETRAFLRDVDGLFTDDELADLKLSLASSPLAGDLIPGTGGLRKIRFRGRGKGKRGGARVIYFFYTPDIALYLLAAYGKGEKIDLSPAEKRTMRQIVSQIKLRHQSKPRLRIVRQ